MPPVKPAAAKARPPACRSFEQRLTGLLRPAVSLGAMSIFRFICLALLCLAALPPAVAQPSPRQDQFGVIFSSGLFPAINRNDIVAAVQMLGAVITRRQGIPTQPVAHVVDSTDQIRQRLDSGFSGLVIVNVLEQLQLNAGATLVPAFFSARSDGGNTYLLLTRNDSSLDSLPALRGKRLIINAYSSANLGQVWLDHQLRELRLDASSRHFSSVEVVYKNSAAIVPVFFGKADAAVVDEVSFQTNKELNPAIGSALRVMLKGRPLPEAIISFTRNLAQRDAVCQALQDLHKTPEGRQLLTIFRISQLVPIDAQRLEEVRALLPKRQ